MGLKKKIIAKLKKGKKEAPPKEYTAEEISNLWLSTFLPFATHVMTKNAFESVFEKSPISSKENDVKIYERLKEVIISRIKAKTIDVDDLWQTYIVSKHADFLQKVMNNQDDEAIDILNNMFDNELVYGFEATNSIHDIVFTSKTAKQAIHLMYMSSLVDLCEYLNLLLVENIEQKRMGENVLKNPDELLDLLEDKLGLKIKFPAFKDKLFTIQTKRGDFTFRDMTYLYFAIKIKEMFPKKENIRVCEIGGGMGYLAYYLNMLGVKDVTIVDIPTTSNTSAWFLMKSLPKRKFLFETDKDIFADTESIKLITPETFMKAPENRFDVVINSDSFPEINKEIVSGYLDKIRNVSEKFYSINHETRSAMVDLEMTHNIVPELIALVNAGHGKHFKRLSRNLFWLHRGYVEELYEIGI